MTLPRDQARRYTLLAKAAAGALVLAAGALLVVPLPLSAETVPGTTAGTPPPMADPPAPPPDRSELDVPLLGSALEGMGHPPEAAPEPEQPVTAQPASPMPEPASIPAAPVRFIGSIIGPRARHALISRGGVQQLVSIGDEIDGMKVVAIERSHITLEQFGIANRLDLAPKIVDWAIEPPAARPPGVPTRPSGMANPNPAAAAAEQERLKSEAERAARLRQMRGAQPNAVPPGRPGPAGIGQAQPLVPPKPIVPGLNPGPKPGDASPSPAPPPPAPAETPPAPADGGADSGPTPAEQDGQEDEPGPEEEEPADEQPEGGS
ncbi:MAG TPA: hypothetical protein VD963_09590 [Phycisphaerales bacterium]|nr:hypothetical protein [Phycisphaerales bacterium]